VEELTGLKTKAEACREYRLKPEVLSRRRAELLERAPEVSATRPGWGEEQKRVAELERMVGRLTMELEVAKKASAIWSPLSNRSER